jgi:hypothetical protein
MVQFPGRPFGPGRPSIFLARTQRIAFQTMHTSGIASAEAFGTPEIRQLEEKERLLVEYGWRLRVVEEEDGKVAGYLEDYETGEVLKSVVGTDWQDAWLLLGIGTTPPSAELRAERKHRSSD